MYAVISFASVLLIIVLAIIFRSSLKKINEELPKNLNVVLGTATKAVTQLDSIVTTNCLENDVELQRRIAEVEHQIEQLGGIKDINALYHRLHS